MNVRDLSTNHQYPNKKPIINMISWMRNSISNLYNAVLVSVGEIRDVKLLLYYIPEWWVTSNMDERLKEIVEKEAREKEKKTTEQVKDKSIDLKVAENGRPLKGVYRSFVIPEATKAVTDSYFDQTKLYIKALIENQLKEIQSAKVIVTSWVRWKKPLRLAIPLDPEDVQGPQDVTGNTGNNYIRVEMPFDSLMTDVFEGSNIDGLIQRMFTHQDASRKSANAWEWF